MVYNLESNNIQIANQTLPASNFSIKYSAKTDNVNNNESSQTTLKYLDDDLFTLKYIRNKDLYALKSDEIINKYLALDNNNLKEFATKIGITDTSIIPNKIQGIDFEKLLSINEETKNAIITRFMQIIKEEIPEEKYKSHKNVIININDKDISTNAYSLELDQKEIISILTKILNELRMDDNILSIIVEKVKIIDSTSTITAKDLQDMIQDMINELQSIQVVDGQTMKLTVYANNNQLLRTEIAIKNNKVFIDYEKQGNACKVIVSFENQANNDENITQMDTEYRIMYNIKKIELVSNIQDNEKTEIVIITLGDEDNTIKVSIQSKINVAESIQDNTIINVNIDDITYLTSKIDTTITSSDNIEIEELTKENCAIINNFTPQYIKTLSQSIIKRLETVYMQKLEFIKNAQKVNTNNNIINSNEVGGNTQNNDYILSNTIGNTISNTVL